MTSQINPLNIDQNYPVAGQPNNTQGFRDNFTATQTNFQFAATEITDLQNKAVLKAALTGTTLDNNMNDNLIYAAKIQDFSMTAVAITTTSGPIAVDYSAGHYQSISTTGSISLSFINWPATNSYGYIKLQINVTNVAHTLTLPAAVSLGTTGIQGYSANIITFAATGTYEFAFGTKDSGTTITVFDLNRPLSGYTNAFGYIAGAGGTVTQATNKATGVTLNKPTGQITMNNAALASATTVNFTLTNSTIAATDLLVINQTSTANAGGYYFNAICNAGNAQISVRNITAASASDAVVMRYAVIKSVSS
jgi:spore coat protein CotF